jgi:putative integral membrane protein (TIGR02587 family)
MFFALPLLMTMEMWWLGFHMDRGRLALFMLLMVPMLIALDHYSGFEDTASWGEDVVDGMVAYGVGFVASATVLALLAVIGPAATTREMVGMVSLQAIPASFGAVLAHGLLAGAAEGEEDVEERRKREAGYPAQLLFMGAGAVFLAFSMAPTEEMILIAFRMTPLHGLAVMAASLLMMHGFVYAMSFRGAPRVGDDAAGWSLFLRFTVVGYAIALLLSAYVLWTFGRYDELPLALRVREAVVLGFPASLGAAAARLIL